MNHLRITILDDSVIFFNKINNHFKNANLINSVEELLNLKTEILIINIDIIKEPCIIKKINAIHNYSMAILISKKIKNTCLINVVPYNINLSELNRIINNKNFFEIKIYKILYELGLAANLKGYFYIKEALVKMIEGNLLFKDLYRELGKQYNVSPASVERAIRNSIENCWNKANINFINILFGTKLHPNKDRPTNSEFICTIIEFIKVFN